MIWLVPADLRDRYATEWQADLDGAAELGLNVKSVRRGHTYAALHLRFARMKDILTGRKGAWKAVGWWLAFLAMLWNWAVIAPVTVVLLINGIVHARRYKLALSALSVLWAACVTLAVVGWSVGFDYADENRTPPAWTNLWLPAFLLGPVVVLAYLIVRACAAHRPLKAATE